MRPVLFEIGGVSIQSFFFMIMVAALASTYVGIRIGKKEGLSEVALLDMSIVAVLSSLVGSRLFHILVEYPRYYWEDPVRVFYFWQGGFVSLGAFLGSIIGWITYLRLKKLNTLRYVDIGALIAPIIEFFVRAGCLLTGCCYGKPTDFFVHLVFNDPGSTAAYFGFKGVPLHATQAYNMLNSVIFFAILYIVYRRRKFYGQVGAVFLMYYGVTRFLIEFLRGDTDRGVYFGGTISTGQITMVAGFIAGVIMYILCKRKGRKSGEEAPH